MQLSEKATIGSKIIRVLDGLRAQSPVWHAHKATVSADARLQGRGSAPGIGGGLVGPVSAVHVMPVAAHPSLTRRVRSAQWRDPSDRQRTDVWSSCGDAFGRKSEMTRTGKSPGVGCVFLSRRGVDSSRVRIDCYDTTARRDTRAAPLASSGKTNHHPNHEPPCCLSSTYVA